MRKNLNDIKINAATLGGLDKSSFPTIEYLEYAGFKGDFTTDTFIAKLKEIGALTPGVKIYRNSFSYSVGTITDTPVGVIGLMGSIIEVLCYTDQRFRVSILSGPVVQNGSTDKTLYYYIQEKDNSSSYRTGWIKMTSTTNYNTMSINKIDVGGVN